MTLVVTDVSRHGIVMVGDSAITILEGDPKIVGTEGGAAKVQYSPELNLGITVWGYGDVGGLRVDQWVCDFLASLDKKDDLETVGERIVRELNAIRDQEGLTGNPETWGGFQLASYLNDIPRLWHVHNGHEGKPVREFRLHRDYPDDQGWPDEEFIASLRRGWSVHLRNGYLQVFSALFDSLDCYRKRLRKEGILLPREDLQGRLEFYKMLIGFVADTLKAAEVHPGVNNKLSAVAFTQEGLVVDELLPVQRQIAEYPAGCMLGF